MCSLLWKSSFEDSANRQDLYLLQVFIAAWVFLCVRCRSADAFRSRFVIIVRLCYLSANTTQAGTVECLNTIAHTERLQYFAHCSKATGLDAFLRHCFRNSPRQYHIYRFWFWKGGLIFENILLSIIKSVRRLIRLRTLEFLISKKRRVPV